MTLTKQELEEKLLKILITPKNKPIVAVSDIRVAYKDEVSELLTLMLDFASEIVGEDEYEWDGSAIKGGYAYYQKQCHRNQVRQELRAKIQELREGK